MPAPPALAAVKQQRVKPGAAEQNSLLRPDPQGPAVFIAELPLEEDLRRSGWREIAKWLVGRRRLYRVTGGSMTPTLPAGAVLMLRAFKTGGELPREGEIVVARHPRQPAQRIVKRVAAVYESDTGEKRLLLASDNRPAGVDSRDFGPVSAGHLLGRVTSRLL